MGTFWEFSDSQSSRKNATLLFFPRVGPTFLERNMTDQCSPCSGRVPKLCHFLRRAVRGKKRTAEDLATDVTFGVRAAHIETEGSMFKMCWFVGKWIWIRICRVSRHLWPSWFSGCQKPLTTSGCRWRWVAIGFRHVMLKLCDHPITSILLQVSLDTDKYDFYTMY